MANSGLDLLDLNDKLQRENQGYWFHLQGDTKLDKYPAKQHARDVATKLRVLRGLIYLAGEKTIMLRDSDQAVPFRQRRYFYYLSGCNESDCHLLYDIGKDVLTLFIPEIDFRKAVWGGAGSSKGEAYAKYDVDVVEYIPELPKAVKKWFLNNGEGKLYLLDPPGEQSFDLKSKQKGRVDTTYLKSAIELNRVIKYPHEITLIRSANKISADAHTAVLKNIRSFKNEREVEGVFLDTCVSAGAHNQAYNIIAGSGTNAAVLHYGKNDEPLEGRQVLLIDAGAEWECYACDVTRTFPISGYWSDEAKNIYDVVNDMQAQCIALMRPGVHYRDLQILAIAIATKGLIKLGILTGSVEEVLKAGTTLAFFPHGLGHHVGLEVHDVLNVPIQSAKEIPVGDMSVYEGTDLHEKPSAFIANLYNTFIDPSVCMTPVTVDSPTLEEGMVVTVEPGIYFSDYALTNVYLPDPKHAQYINKEVLAKYMPVGGVRIEDDILITKTGRENLTTTPKGDAALKIIRGEDDSSTVEDEGVKFSRAEKGKAPMRESIENAGQNQEHFTKTKGETRTKYFSGEVENCRSWEKEKASPANIEMKFTPDVKPKNGDVLPPASGQPSLLSAFPFVNPFDNCEKALTPEVSLAPIHVQAQMLAADLGKARWSTDGTSQEQIKRLQSLANTVKMLLDTYVSFTHLEPPLPPPLSEPSQIDMGTDSATLRAGLTPTASLFPPLNGQASLLSAFSINQGVQSADALQSELPACRPPESNSEYLPFSSTSRLVQRFTQKYPDISPLARGIYTAMRFTHSPAEGFDMRAVVGMVQIGVSFADAWKAVRELRAKHMIRVYGNLKNMRLMLNEPPPARVAQTSLGTSQEEPKEVEQSSNPWTVFPCYARALRSHRDGGIGVRFRVQQGDVVEVMGRTYADSFYVRLGDTKGHVPISDLRKISAEAYHAACGNLSQEPAESSDSAGSTDRAKWEELEQTAVPCYFRATTDYDTPGPYSHWLTFKTGDVMKVLEKQEDGTWYVLLGERRGYVSSSSLREMPASEHPVDSCLVQASEDYDGCYKGQRDPTCLIFKQGDIIELVTKKSKWDGWWVGRLKEVMGWVPSNRVRDIALRASPAQGSQPSSDYVKALYDYEVDANDSSSLAFKRDDLIHILERRDAGWWDAFISGSGRGWIPANYVRELTEAERLGHNPPAPAPCDEAPTDPAQALAAAEEAKQKEEERLLDFFCRSLTTALYVKVPNIAVLDREGKEIRALLENKNREGKICFAGLCLQLKHDHPMLDLTLRDALGFPIRGMDRLRTLYSNLRLALGSGLSGSALEPHRSVGEVERTVKEAFDAAGVKEEEGDEGMGICMNCQFCRDGFAKWDEKWLGEEDMEEGDDEDE